MSHYRRGDPETGCFLMLIGIAAVLFVVLMALLFDLILRIVQ